MNNELIPISKGESIFDMKLTSREIAKVTGKEHFNVMRDIRGLISNGSIDQLNFEDISLPDSYNRMQPAFELDYDATMTLISGYDSRLRMAVVRRMRELDQGIATPLASQQPQIPQTLSEALRLAADQAEKIERDAPKVAYVEDVVEQTRGTIQLSQFGRVLKKEGMNTGAKKIFTQLRKLGVMLQSKPVPYDRFIDQKLFVVSSKVSLNRVDSITYVTGKGQLWVHNKLKEMLGNEPNKL